MINLFFAVTFFSVTTLFAQDCAQPTSGFPWSDMMLPMVMIFVIMYFFMIRPEQRKQKEKQKMVDTLTKGSKVLTIGGVYGTVGSVKDDIVMLRIAENTTVKISKSAISTVVTDSNGATKKKKS